MIITLKRIRKRPETIDGQLYIDDRCICDTAENAKSAIKAGQYPISICKCHQYARKMPVIQVHKKPSQKCARCKELEYVNGNTRMPLKCPMLKPGNGVHKRKDGSILVGDYIALGCLKHPKKAFDTIYDRIRKNIERGNEVTLIITEDYPKPRVLTPYEMGQLILSKF